ncbi:MAG: polyphosphate kinase 2 family protein [Aestuariivirgaceae bacterium]|nr:polyphosphate kinase 2 family protein [Aestuariivirgaceae bacterium]
MTDFSKLIVPFTNAHPTSGESCRGGMLFADEAQARALTRQNAKAINELQDRLYAEGKRSLLVVLQGMDTAGKDGTIRGVFGETGALGVAVTSFRQPSVEELAHDYLWRAHIACPRRGMIGIFNRSHYEDVLVVRVKGYASPEQIEKRYAQINDFERILSENGTKIVKFMLNISAEEQRERLQERLDQPEKRWKFNAGDLDDRKLWVAFMEAYNIMLQRTSTLENPWHVIPADQKWARNAIISSIVRKTLEEMNPQYPQVDLDPDLKII